jgi:hypothetical protein
MTEGLPHRTQARPEPAPEHGCENFHSSFAAPRVLEENLINVERVEFAGTVAIDGLTNAGDKFSQLCAVVVRDH